MLLHVLHNIVDLDFYLSKFAAMGTVSIVNYIVVSRFIFDTERGRVGQRRDNH